MHFEPAAITFIPCEEHFRPVLPTNSLSKRKVLSSDEWDFRGILKAKDQSEGGTELDHRAAELRALGGWRIKRFEPSITDCLGYYDLYETIGAYYKAEEKAVHITRKYFVSILSDKKRVLREK